MSRRFREVLAVVIMTIVGYVILLGYVRPLFDRMDVRHLEAEDALGVMVLDFVPRGVADLEVLRQMDTNEFWGCFSFGDEHVRELDTLPLLSRGQSDVRAPPVDPCPRRDLTITTPVRLAKNGYELRVARSGRSKAIIAVHWTERHAMFWTTAH